ncbi:MAG: DUF4124 domain-containing protein [Thioalkalispiraceae bacterium]|jgi:predicted RNase H-like nuclease (RuvC/YqgF family)
MDHRKLALVFFFSCFLHNVHAEIYKWTDEKGQVHYGDKSAGSNAKRIPYKSKPNNDSKPVDAEVPAGKTTKQIADQMEQSRLQREKEKKKKDEEQRKKQKVERCTEARKQITKLQNKIRELEKLQSEHRTLERNEELRQKRTELITTNRDIQKNCY